MIPLSSRLAAWPDPGRAVAFGRAGTRDSTALRRDVAALVAALDPVRGSSLLLHCDDAYAFAVGLLAALRVGSPVTLPPSRQPGVLERLRSEVMGAIVDGEEPAPGLGSLPRWHPLELRPLEASQPDTGAEPFALERAAPLATLFTSGSTGTGSRVPKAVRHLEDEIEVLERRFGAELGPDTRILTTVSPQHLYGLLFRVLWPLCAGRPFQRVAALHPQELTPHAAGGPYAVVTTPSALRHLVARGELAEYAADCRAVFCSGGPLSAELARHTARALGHTPCEIYGSTETGGIAVRRQHRGDEPWECLAGVELEPDPASGCAAVLSPFASVGAEAPDGRRRFVTGDRVRRVAGAGFELLGRADRIVKVGEKRLSLAEMEVRLAQHPAVDEAALVTLDGASGETRVGAVVRPSAAAADTLESGGQRALGKLLSEFLAPDFERVFLPRAWRFAAALPRDAQGKLPTERLRALFGSDASPRTPERLAAERGEGELVLQLRIPWDLAFFEGHYPGHPLVAGVVQVRFAVHALEELLGEPPEVERLEALKFHEPLGPGEEVTLRVSADAARRRFEFALVDAARPERAFASGRGFLRAREGR